MKKNILILLSLITFTAMAQTKGKFEVLDLKDFKLHVYYTNDALNDASYIVEGKNGLITLEQPLFKDNVAEFDCLCGLVEQTCTDNHHRLPCGWDGKPRYSNGRRYASLYKRSDLRRNDAELRRNFRRCNRTATDRESRRN